MHNKYCSSLVAQNRRKYRGKRYISTVGKNSVEIHTNIGKIHKINGFQCLRIFRSCMLNPFLPNVPF